MVKVHQSENIVETEGLSKGRVAVAIRSALRCFPALTVGISEKNQKLMDQTYLRAFRGMSATSSFVWSPNGITHRLAADAAQATELFLDDQFLPVELRNTPPVQIEGFPSVDTNEGTLAREAVHLACAATIDPKASKDAVRLLLEKSNMAIKLAAANQTEVNMACVQRDVEVMKNSGLGAALKEPLWSAYKEPPRMGVMREQRMEEYFSRSIDDWGFWQKLYSSFLEGRVTSLGLWPRIAEIPNNDWKQGTSHIADQVKRLELAEVLLDKIDELEQALRAAGNSRYGIGGNNPPSQIDGEIRPELIFIWEPLSNLKAEAMTPQQSVVVVRRALTALKACMANGLNWVASKGDLVIDTTIKWGVPVVGGGYVALNPEKIASVIKAGEGLLQILK